MYDFSKIKALLGKASQGTWEHFHDKETDEAVVGLTDTATETSNGLHLGVWVCRGMMGEKRHDNAALIVELRNQIEEIMEYVEELEDEIKNFNSEIGGLKWQD